MVTKVFILIPLFAVATTMGIGQRASGRAKPAKLLPVIDMHIHADTLEDFGGGNVSACLGDGKLTLPAFDPKSNFKMQDLVDCERTIKSASSDAVLKLETVAELKRHNVRRAVAMGDLSTVTDWVSADPDRLIPSLNFSDRSVEPATYRRLFAEGKFKMFGEIGPQYRGFAPADAVYAQYFALAEELDIPVGIHMGEGPPGGIHILGPPTYRVKLGSPLLLEDLIIRHPKLRIYVMHYGSPLVDEMIAMMFSHPNLYVDISCNNWALPRKQFYDHLERMIDAGFEKRILFGSDQMAWPATIGKAIESVEQAPFLNKKQKRNIFYNNAARFLRLRKDEIAADHK
ncbi:MAG: amidohydrolase family protein [bacterium]|nr:amidohydrolase family protein [bacterium]